MSEPAKIKVKDYQIHFPPLGEGSFGTVYRATYRGISDRALKVYRPGAVDIVTMARELEKLSKVAEHNGIVTLHDFDLVNEPPHYAMGLHADLSADGTWRRGLSSGSAVTWTIAKPGGSFAKSPMQCPIFIGTRLCIAI